MRNRGGIHVVAFSGLSLPVPYPTSIQWRYRTGLKEGGMQMQLISRMSVWSFPTCNKLTTRNAVIHAQDVSGVKIWCVKIIEIKIIHIEKWKTWYKETKRERLNKERVDNVRAQKNFNSYRHPGKHYELFNNLCSIPPGL